jgi:phage shock protein PspC (stress-responsive transcriptional regulator)
MRREINRIERPYTGSVLAGVCAGIAEYFSIDITFLRILWFLSFFCYGFGIIMYAVLWVLLPTDGYRNW